MSCTWRSCGVTVCRRDGVSSPGPVGSTTCSSACKGTVKPLHELTGVPVDYVAPAVDMIRWADRRPDAARAVDIHWFGRRDQAIHDRLKAYAKRSQRFYLYDTAIRSDPEDMADHRDQFRSRLTATKIAIVLPAKINRGDEIRKQHEVGFRFFECLAAGTVLVGEPPRTHVADGSAWAGRTRSCRSIPSAISNGRWTICSGTTAGDARISARNTRESLCRHDVAHRCGEDARAPRLAETARARSAPHGAGRFDRALRRRRREPFPTWNELAQRETAERALIPAPRRREPCIRSAPDAGLGPGRPGTSAAPASSGSFASAQKAA